MVIFILNSICEKLFLRTIYILKEDRVLQKILTY